MSLREMGAAVYTGNAKFKPLVSVGVIRVGGGVKAGALTHSCTDIRKTSRLT